MESLSLKNLISAAYRAFPVRYSVNPFIIRRIGTKSPHIQLVVRSKKWDFQDYQGYAKPIRLFPASEVQNFTPSSLEHMIDIFKMQTSESLYKVKLQTSSIYGSGLTDMNSGVLLCLIDENSDSILQRIPACLAKSHSVQWEGNAISEFLHFQRGCVDEFIFKGPGLKKIAAVWISLDSGQWRLGNLSLTVISQQQSLSTENENKHMQYIGLQYDFEIEDILLGEGSDISMTEIRPSSVAEFSEEDFTHLSVKALQPSSLASYSISSEESMKEYADLKFSLLFYDAMLIFAGSSFASFTAGENAAFAFLAGGFGGFLYLLLLQRSVDGLPSRELIQKNGTSKLDQFFGKFKSSATSLVLAFVLAAIAAKYTSGDSAAVLTPKELIFGMIGFLMCKVAVILAAFKPMPIGLRENK